MIARVALIAGLAALAAGCTNSPATLPRIDADRSVMSHPMYGRADAYSFSRAEVKYPAAGGSHTVQVGDYLLGRLLDHVSGRNVEELRLVEFSAVCAPSRPLAPKVVCPFQAEISFKSAGRRLSIKAAKAVDIGGQLVKDQNLLLIVGYIDTGGPDIQNQVKAGLDQFLPDLLSKV